MLSVFKWKDRRKTGVVELNGNEQAIFQRRSRKVQAGTLALKVSLVEPRNDERRHERIGETNDSEA